jgi:hypothetical protein
MAGRRLTDAEILAQIPAARAREARARKQGLRATRAKFDRRARRIVLELTSGHSFAFPVKSVRALEGVTDAQLSSVELDPSGVALRWDALDIDLSVPGLLFSAFGERERFSHLASLAGRVTTEAKARAARANGRKGGRPKKRISKPKPKAR